MELEFFCKPGTDLEWFDYWKNFCTQWLYDLGIKKENLKLRDHDKTELCFYSKATTDFEFLFPFGWGELWGIADRTDYDLSQHMKTSSKDLSYVDPVTNEKYIPYVIEPSLGVDRMVLAFLCNAYEEEQIDENDSRVVLKLHPVLAPVKVAILPLQKQLNEKAEELFKTISANYNCEFDTSGSIGKRYRRQDEIGTPFCVTVDFESLENDTVTIRERDTMCQTRVSISELESYLQKAFKY